MSDLTEKQFMAIANEIDNQFKFHYSSSRINKPIITFFTNGDVLLDCIETYAKFYPDCININFRMRAQKCPN